MKAKFVDIIFDSEDIVYCSEFKNEMMSDDDNHFINKIPVFIHSDLIVRCELDDKIINISVIADVKRINNWAKITEERIKKMYFILKLLKYIEIDENHKIIDIEKYLLFKNTTKKRKRRNLNKQSC